jgi:hypothetical protein
MLIKCQRYKALIFLLPLAREMTHEVPDKRPTLDLALQNMTTQFAGLASWRRRWPIIPPNTSFRHRCMFVAAGLTTEVVIFFRKILRLFLLRGLWN